jgi:hypothetical protein
VAGWDHAAHEVRCHQPDEGDQPGLCHRQPSQRIGRERRGRRWPAG